MDLTHKGMELLNLISSHYRFKCHRKDAKYYSNLLIMTKQLIRAGHDLMAVDTLGMTALHIAITSSLLDIAHELIKAGANINQRDLFFKGTPLHHAIKGGNLEAVCMLLYYGADVNIGHHFGMTSFMYAIEQRQTEIADILFDYCDDFTYKDKKGRNALHIALVDKDPIAFRLISVADPMEWALSQLAYSCRYNSADLFKFIWHKLDDWSLAEDDSLLLLLYLQKCRFSPEEWLECIYLILSSPAALNFVINTLNRKINLLSILLHNFNKKRIEKTDRITIIHICLSLGAEANFTDIVTAYKYYGFGAEVEAMLYVYDNEDNNTDCNFLLPIFITNQETDYNRGIIFKLLKKQMYYNINFSSRNIFINDLKHFALPSELKDQLLALCNNKCLENQNGYNEIYNEIEGIPEIPSLVELSRNQARLAIRESYNVSKPYQFRDALRNLHLPQLIKDIICFKKAIYT